MNDQLIKFLSSASANDLRQAFPIILEEHSANYKNWYEAERKNILSKIKADDIARVNHIGSSAVEGLISKPIIDILLEVDGCCKITSLIDNLKNIGWDGPMRQGSDPMSLMFSKGYTPGGFADKVYHLHVRYPGNWDELYFRDYLIKHPDIANEYGRLKMELLKNAGHDISVFEDELYVNAKFDFVKKYSDMAK